MWDYFVCTYILFIQLKIILFKKGHHFINHIVWVFFGLELNLGCIYQICHIYVYLFMVGGTTQFKKKIL